MTIEELYGKVLADDELKAGLVEAAKQGKVAEWAAGQGVEATEDELLAYARSAVTQAHELTEEQLDKVAGGDYTRIVQSIGRLDLECFGL